jgi:hypothetical protein
MGAGMVELTQTTPHVNPDNPTNNDVEEAATADASEIENTTLTHSSLPSSPGSEILKLPDEGNLNPDKTNSEDHQNDTRFEEESP